MADPCRDEVEPVLRLTLEAGLAYLAAVDRAPTREQGAVEYAQAWSPELSGSGLGAEGALDQLAELGLRAGVASSGPRYFHYVVGGVTPAALAGQWLGDVMDQVASSWTSSPAAARLEEVVLDWLLVLLELPRSWSGVLVSGAHQANQTCLAAARQWWGKQHGVDVSRDGLFGLPVMPVLAGGYLHASIPKALAGLGLGTRCVQRFDQGGQGRLDLGALSLALDELGDTPAVLVISAGEVNSGDFDPLEAALRLVAGRRVWVHVDGAFGLCTRAAEEFREWTAGIEGVQSAALDAHKWLNVPTGCGVAFVADKRFLAAPHRLRGGYLPGGDQARTVFANLGPEMSRPPRAFALWSCLAAYGQQGVAGWIRRHVELAREFGRRIDAEQDFERLAPVHSNVVCFRLRPAGMRARLLDELNESFVRQVNDAGRVELGSTRFGGRVALRVAFANWRTEQDELELLLDALRLGAARIESA
ncbi:MAG: glutamate/tyrosine decarboxylase-like PLP-dependent enzyme [Planctomycetota bacterium]|jgi:glutamate/tyrosine decarboxylase-like PLP-dependent enzyme